MLCSCLKTSVLTPGCPVVRGVISHLMAVSKACWVTSGDRLTGVEKLG